MFLTNKLNLVDKVWSKYLLDTLDLSLRKKLIGRKNDDTINNSNINNKYLNNNSNTNNKIVMIIYGVSCFVAGYYFKSKV